MEEQILDFFKTFVDINRMRVAVLLAERACTPVEIAETLRLRPVEVQRHLEQIEKLGLLKQEVGGYRLDTKALETLSRQALANRRPTVTAHSDDENADSFDRQVIKNYSLPDGRLKEIPTQEKKFLAVLRHVVQVIEPGRRYTEKEVNEALKRYNADFATLRRGLVDRQLINREPNGTAYWREG